jgi:hypothetical protein
MEYPYIRQDLDSISTYLNHTIVVYVHTFMYGDIEIKTMLLNEMHASRKKTMTRVCILTIFTTKYMYIMIGATFTRSETPINDMMICSLMLKSDLKLFFYNKKINA